MWEVLKLDGMTVTAQGIHIMVKVYANQNSWILSTIYASSDFNSHTTLWGSLIRISQNYNGMWLIGGGGGFNEVL